MDNNKSKNIKPKKSNGTDKPKNKEALGITRAVPVILIAIALFLTLCYITADTGAFGKFISNAFMGLFSYMAYTIPFFISLHAICFFSDYRDGKIVKRIIFSAVALTMLSMVAYVITVFRTGVMVFDASSYYIDGTNLVGGGVVGNCAAYACMQLFGKIGLIIILSLTAIVYVIYLASGGGAAFSNFFLKKIAGIVNYGAKIEKRREEKRMAKNEGKEAKHRASDDKKNRDLYNDEYFGTDNGVSRLEIPELGILETKTSRGTAHILRETVIKNDEEKTAETEDKHADSYSAYRKKINDIFVDTDSSFVRTEASKDGDDIVYEPKSTGTEFELNEETPVGAKSGKDYGIDDSADAIFTESFDPYDIAMNEKRKNKASSRADNGKEAPKGFSEYIASMTPEEAEHLKRLEAFEESKRRAIERMRRDDARSGHTQFNQADDYSNGSVSDEDNNGADALRVAEEARLREQALLANYGKDISSSEARQDRNGANTSSAVFGTAVGVSAASAPTSSQARTENDKYRFVNNTAYEPRIAYSSGSIETQPQHTAPASQPQHTAPVSQPQYTAPASQTQYTTPASQPQYTAPASQPQYTTPISQPQTSWTRVENPAVTKDDYSTPAYQPVNTPKPQYKAPEENTYSAMRETSTEIKKSFSFIEVDENEAEDIPISENATEFTFDTDTEEEDFSPINTDEGELLEISRSMAEPELSIPDEEDTEEEKFGLDFSVDESDGEEEGDFSSEDIEEPIGPTEIPEAERNPDIEGYKKMFNIFDEDEDESEEESYDKIFEAPERTEEPDDIDESNEDIDLADAPMDDFDEEADDKTDDEPPFEMPVKAPVKPEKVEKPKAPKPDYSKYKFPPVDLLNKSPEEDWESINREIQFGGEQLINTLDSFNIKATIRGMEHGPRITRYSIVPAKGVRVSQIEKLSDDIALALAAESIRIEAPIPGKAAVGVEVPNKKSSLVTLRDLLESDEFINEPSKTYVCIGKSVEGSLVYGDIGSMPHVLIAGATGMGKSVCINSLITSILYKARPDEVKFIMIDPKKVEFAPYSGLPHLLIPVVTDPKQAAGALMWAVDEMNKRYEIIEKVRVKNIDSYNRKVAETPELGAPMSKIVIFIDELNDLMVQVRDPVENLIMLLAQKSRAAGIHLVIGTQRPSVDVLTGVIKANIPTRIACKVSSGIDSRTILEKTGAEKLIGKGDMLFAIPGKEPKRVQGAFVSDGETEAIVEFIKEQVGGEVYDEEALEDIKRAAQKCDKSKNDDELDDDDDEGSGVGYLQDRKFLNAVELAIRNGNIATSLLQRKLHIGYGKAASYIDIMEDLGIVGEKNGSKARDVLISMDEWNEKLSRLTEDY